MIMTELIHAYMEAHEKFNCKSPSDTALVALTITRKDWLDILSSASQDELIAIMRPEERMGLRRSFMGKPVYVTDALETLLFTFEIL